MSYSKLEYETFLDVYDDDLYIAFMESGCYYDMEREDFDEAEYEEYLRGVGRWSQKRKESSTPAKVWWDTPEERAKALLAKE